MAQTERSEKGFSSEEYATEIAQNNGQLLPHLYCSFRSSPAEVLDKLLMLAICYLSDSLLIYI